MDKLLIEWGKLHRTQSIENAVKEQARKILTRVPEATKLIVGFQILNPVNSSGAPLNEVSMELRKPNHQDIRASKKGENLYHLIHDTERALLSQNR